MIKINGDLYTEGWPGIGLQGEQKWPKDQKEGIKRKEDEASLFF